MINPMPDLRELYQEMIIDHGRNPRNFRNLPSANRTAEGFNPLCGDRLTLYLQIEEEHIKVACFEGVGCAICMASASLMTEQLFGKTEPEANKLFQNFHQQVTSKNPDQAVEKTLGKLSALCGVRAFPTRIKCATLAWHTLQSALASKVSRQPSTPISTEDSHS